MEGSKADNRTFWKQSVKKYNPNESRLFGDQKQFPNKFSPSRPIVSPKKPSIIKQKFGDLSQDEIKISDSKLLGRARNKSFVQGQTVRTPRSNIDGQENKINSEAANDNKKNNTLTFKRGQSQIIDMDYVRELKFEFLRFKQKVLKQLKKQEQDMKAVIKEIQKKLIMTQQKQNVSSARSSLSFSASAPKMNLPILSPASFMKTLQSIKLPEMPSQPTKINLQGIKAAIQSQRTAYKSTMPNIKQELNRLSELMTTLKQQVNRQNIVSAHESL